MPNDFLLQLEMLRELPESRAVIEETEELLAHVLRTIDEDALMQLIVKTTEEDFPN